MSEAGQKMDYDFSNKRHWRKTIWNELIRKMDMSKNGRDGVVLYLGGREDPDREILLKKGFRNENLICIDRDASVVREIRSRGHLAICGDILQVVCHWPLSVRISGVFYDFCSPITDKNFMDIAHMIIFNAHPVAVNLLRGREQGVTGKMIHHVKAFSGSDIIRYSQGEILFRGNIGQTKYFSTERLTSHRGFLLLTKALTIMDEHGVFALVHLPPQESAVLNYVKNSDIHLYSYMSKSGQVFDTITVKENFHDRKDYMTCTTLLKPDKGLARSISAVLAHRTMRSR